MSRCTVSGSRRTSRRRPSRHEARSAPAADRPCIAGLGAGRPSRQRRRRCPHRSDAGDTQQGDAGAADQSVLDVARARAAGARPARQADIAAASGDGQAAMITTVAIGRAALFFALWLMIAGYQPADFPVGLAAAALATWASLRLLPPSTLRLRLWS